MIGLIAKNYYILCIAGWDGHAGIGKIFQEIGDTEQRQEILDWYHLKENLYKVGGSLKRLKLAENMLWQGKIDEVINLFKEMKKTDLKYFVTI